MAQMARLASRGISDIQEDLLPQSTFSQRASRVESSQLIYEEKPVVRVAAVKMAVVVGTAPRALQQVRVYLTASAALAAVATVGMAGTVGPEA
jgi:hypothetical protein